MDLDEALDICRGIISDAEDVPERGEDFADGVTSTATDIMETIEERGAVTPNQAQALTNMRNGLDKWLS